MSKTALRITSAVWIGVGLSSFGPAGEALYLNLRPHHTSAAAVGFWITAWLGLGVGTAYRIAAGGRD